ncbi:hypothetical protein U3A55_11815 [Salarchaeum sp. III]|uniref:hypothetical protein n=1 Tax=Salarchaeum sp. III TaxID=3107927 RepID=UPI002ED93FD9
MSTSQNSAPETATPRTVEFDFAGHQLEGEVADVDVEAEFGRGPRDIFVVARGEATYRVPEDDVRDA